MWSTQTLESRHRWFTTSSGWILSGVKVFINLSNCIHNINPSDHIHIWLLSKLLNALIIFLIVTVGILYLKLLIITFAVEYDILFFNVKVFFIHLFIFKMKIQSASPAPNERKTPEKKIF